MAEHQNSSVGNHLAELYNQIHVDQQAVDAAKESVKQAEAALEKTKSTFANYLKESGIDKLLAPAQQHTALIDLDPNFGDHLGRQRQERKPRTSSADKQAEVERNKAIYVGSYPLGINEKTGLPVRYKGRSSANDAIDAQMQDDERDYSAKSNGAGADGGDDNESLTNNDVNELVGAKKPTTKKK